MPSKECFDLPLSVLSILLVFLSSCTQQKNGIGTINGTWMGSYYNQFYQVPIPTVLEFKGEQLIETNYDGIQKFPFKLSTTELLLGDSIIKLNELSPYRLKLYHPSEDSSRFWSNHIHNADTAYCKLKYWEYARPKASNLTNNIKELQSKLIEESSWTIDRNFEDSRLIQRINLQFEKDTIYLERLYQLEGQTFEKEYEKQLWKLKQVAGEYYIFRKSGHKYNRELAPLQLLEIGNTLQLLDYYHVLDLGWASTKRNIETYYKSEHSFSIEAERYFSLNNERYVPESYLADLSYKGKQAALNNYYIKQLPSKEASGQSGTITLRFSISSKGKVGRLHSLEIDNKYQQISFDDDYLKQFIHLALTDTNWLSLDGSDYQQSLNLKLKEGKILEVWPIE